MKLSNLHTHAHRQILTVQIARLAPQRRGQGRNFALKGRIENDSMSAGCSAINRIYTSHSVKLQVTVDQNASFTSAQLKLSENYQKRTELKRYIKKRSEH